MAIETLIDIPVKPRVLIADDSRIVRATLIKHIEGMFDFREALDGEEAWETLLIDPNIRVVITDLTMPKLDGYGLLQRIRSSKIGRIRDMPVVVVSGSDEQEERERAKAAGANDLITKGIGTAQLLSRLDILSKLVTTQKEFERSLEALARTAPIEGPPLPTIEVFRFQAGALLSAALKSGRNFVILNVRVGMKLSGLDGAATAPPATAIEAIGRLLQQTVRQTDCVAKTGEAEFLLATGSINFDAARFFAHRVSRAIAAANLLKDERMAFVTSVGLASLSEHAGVDRGPALEELCETASRRAGLGFDRAAVSVIGPEEEQSWKKGSRMGLAAAQAGDALAPDLATLVQWIKEGRREDVMPHIEQLPPELRPLVNLALQRGQH